MSDEVEAINMIWKAGLLVIGVGGTVVSFFTKRVINDVDYLKKSDADCRLDLANFKTEVAKDYAKRESTQQSLARIHDKMESGFDTLHKDVKSILTIMKK